MPTLETSLDRRMGRLERVRKRIKHKIRLVAIVRTLFFISLLFFIFYYSASLRKPWYSLITISGFVCFYFLIRYSGNLRFFIDKLDGSLHAIRLEKERLARKKDSVYKDPDFSDLIYPSHFWQDLDLGGSQGLIKTINTTFTRQGEKLFLTNILRAEKETYNSILQRQSLIQSLAGKKNLVLKYLRITAGIKVDLRRLQASEIHFFQKRKLLKSIFRPITYLTLLSILVHAVFDIPFSSLFILMQLLLYAVYRNHSKKELSRFEAVFSDLAIIHKSIYHLNQYLTNKPERKEIHNMYSQLEKVANRVSIAFAPAPHFILNLLFLWDLWNLAALEKWFCKYQEVNAIWLDELAALDALMPFALLKLRHPEFIFPEINTNHSFHASGMKHPFLPHGIGNDILQVSGGNITIVTGSNMAGKTTYLRTIGINAVIGLSGGPVAADSYSLPWNMDIFSSIRNHDSMEEGVSLFYAEVKKLADILRMTQDKEYVHLILLDEILKGTNSRERLIASRAVLDHLAKTTAIVFITTHDLELARFFNDAGILFRHFAEEIREGKMHFDYKIKEGIVHSSNALKIMEMEGLNLDFGND